MYFSKNLGTLSSNRIRKIPRDLLISVPSCSTLAKNFLREVLEKIYITQWWQLYFYCFVPCCHSHEVQSVFSVRQLLYQEFCEILLRVFGIAIFSQLYFFHDLFTFYVQLSFSYLLFLCPSISQFQLVSILTHSTSWIQQKEGR